MIEPQTQTELTREVRKAASELDARMLVCGYIAKVHTAGIVQGIIIGAIAAFSLAWGLFK